MGISVWCDETHVIVESYSFGTGVFRARGATVIASLFDTDSIVKFLKSRKGIVSLTCFSNLRRPPVALFSKPEVNSSKELKDAGPVSSLRCDVLSAVTEFSTCL